jgi:cytochrome c oxidase assembly protein subunit 15
MRFFHLFSLLTLVVAAVAVWWGATVTTNDVGLSVPDWPLAYGQINPPGWTKVAAIFQEHGHRWATSIVGVLVLIQYLWQFAKYKPGFLEVSGIILCGIAFLYLVHQGGKDVPGAWTGAITIAILALIWAPMTWVAAKWPFLRGLTVFALFLVIVQASLGGLRVLKMSDPYGIAHGTLGQLFFCLLVLIAFASSRTWRQTNLALPAGDILKARIWSGLLFLAVFLQLLFGAIVRHTQRQQLAAHDILTTGGQSIPPTDQPDLFHLFLHKYWGFVVALLVLHVAWQGRHWLKNVQVLRWIPKLLLIMPLIQVTLGICVILTGKNFWVTNLHVYNGLGLLVLTFLMAVSIWAGTFAVGLDAQEDAEGATKAQPDKPASLA